MRKGKNNYVSGSVSSYGYKHGSYSTCMAAESESTDGFNLNLCIASEPQSIDPALNTAMMVLSCATICSKVWSNGQRR